MEHSHRCQEIERQKVIDLMQKSERYERVNLAKVFETVNSSSFERLFSNEDIFVFCSNSLEKTGLAIISMET